MAVQTCRFLIAFWASLMADASIQAGAKDSEQIIVDLGWAARSMSRIVTRL